MNTTTLSLAAALACLTSCSTSISRPSVPDRYYDQNNFFCIDTPELYKYDMQTYSNGACSGVSFHDQWGGFVKFEVSEFPQDDESQKIKELIINDPEVLQSLFHTTIFEEIRALFPETQIVEEQTVTSDDEKMYFVFLKIPGAGSGQNLSTGMRTDSLRGLLIFLTGNTLVIESYQINGICSAFYKEGDRSFVEKTLRELLENKKRYRAL